MNQEEIMRQLQAAVQAYQSKDLDSAEAIFKQILAVNQKEPNALHLLGCIYKDRGQLQQAVELIQASIQVDGSNPIPFLNLGKILAIAGQHENAAGVFQESLKRNQQIPETWFCLGNALKEIQKVEAAKQAYRNALQLNPAYVGAVSNLGALLTDDGELEEAEQLFIKAVEQSPNDVNLRINYGKLLAEKDQHAAAIVQYQLALPLAPQSPELHYNFANALKQEGEVEEAIAIYRKAIEVKPDFAEAYYQLGFVLKEEGDVKAAIANYRKAIELKPDFALAYYQLGFVLKEEGDVKAAIANYRKAIEVKPDFEDAYLCQAIALKEVGDNDCSAAAFEWYFRLKPIARNVSFSSVMAPISDSRKSVTRIEVPKGAEFIPSYVSSDILFGMHLMYVHIPKTAGIRFSNPIFDCIRVLFLSGNSKNYEGIASSASCRDFVSVMASPRIDSDQMRDGMAAAMPFYDLPSLDYSFLTLHGVSSREILSAMRDSFGVRPVRLATWRDPESRLRSSLNYFWRTSGGDLDLIRSRIRKRDPFLDNAIYRGCFDNFYAGELSADGVGVAQVDHLINVENFSLMNRVVSSFLSRCRLPNIVINKRVNVTSSGSKMNSDLLNSLALECMDAGFLAYDGCGEVGAMVEDELPEELCISRSSMSGAFHPWTYLVNGVTDVTTGLQNSFLPTEYLRSDEGQEFLRKSFAE